ncbi:hypothetical protein RKD29_007542 [Streptomyces tendae]|uniref:hypothetical protein n=1 Tax=Streptomyces tendae TaxID=1932 RepID=UPI0038370791
MERARRPDAGTVPDRSFCHTYGRGNARHQMTPGGPYSVVVASETGRTSWSALLEAVRRTPGADLAAIITAQIREVVGDFLLATPTGGRPPRHGGEFVFGDTATWGVEPAVTVTRTRLYGEATAQVWDRPHPRLTQRAA